MKPVRSLISVAACLASFASVAYAEYPEKPVEFIVPWPPGDLEDILTRLIAEDFHKTYGVPAAVVNKPGGGGGPFPGAFEVAKAPADGYTVGSFTIGIPVIGPNLGLEGITSETFDPLGIFLTYPYVVVAKADAGYSSLPELAEYAKSHPVIFGHTGDATIPRRLVVAASKKLGFEFSGEAAVELPDCNTLASGDADVIATTMQMVMPCIDDVTVLASATNERISLLPDTPTIGEIVPELNLSTWNGLFVVRDTPAAAREKIENVARKVMSSDQAIALANKTGALIYWMDADQSKAQIEKDIETMATIKSLVSK